MNEYVIWCNELKKNSGEGELAHKYINHYLKGVKKRKVSLYKSFLFSEYIYPYLAIVILWYYFLKGFKTVYINYLPLWNTPIFLLCPPNTIFGPVTGSIQINKIKNLKSFFRYFIFPILYKLSLEILNLRREKIIFSTNILKKFVRKRILKKSEFNFVLNNLKIKKLKKIKKKFDLIVYYRLHENKFHKHHIRIIKDLIKRKKKIIVIGDKIGLKNVVQLKKVGKKQMTKLIMLSKYCLSGDDNLLSFFNLECLKNNVKILSNTKLKFQIQKNLENKFIFYKSNDNLNNLI